MICTTSELPEEWNFEQIKQDLRPLCLPDDFQYTNDDLNTLTADSIKEMLNKRALDLYAQKETMFAEAGLDMREIERVILLQAVDMHWMAHLDNMDALKGGVGLNAYAQRNPITEYRIAGADMFDAMVNEIREDTVRAIWTVMPKKAPVERKEVAKVTAEGFEGAGGEKKKQMPVKAAQKVGRNDPCPCGSGKKYKKCCGQ